MKKLFKLAVGLMLVLVMAGVFFLYQYGPIIGAQFGRPIYVFPPSPERYGKVALEIMDRMNGHGLGKEWDMHLTQALESLDQTDSYEETYPIIEDALEMAGGKHSFLLTEQNEEAYFAQNELPTVKRQGKIGYIQLPSLANGFENGKDYAETVLTFLEQNQSIAGIVIDLRGNGGGDMGPMITAISPLIPDGEIMYFKKGEHKQPVVLEDGRVTGGGTSVETEVPPFKIDVPIVVLADEGTGSSGEAVLLSLMELENVKTFGKPTAGYATANAAYQLYDGATMVLTVSTMQTLGGQIFGEQPVPVDEETTQPLKTALKELEAGIQAEKNVN